MTLRTDHAAFERGFSLLEVLIVMAILGLATSLVVTRQFGRPVKLDVHSAASQLGQSLRSARMRAIVSNRPAQFNLDVVGHGFAVDAGRVRRLPVGVQLAMTADAALTRGDTIGSIRFYPDGSSSGGRITITRGAARALVQVEWLTGRVVVSER